MTLRHEDGTRESFRPYDDGLMWYVLEGPTQGAEPVLIGWRALAEKVDDFLEEQAP